MLFRDRRAVGFDLSKKLNFAFARKVFLAIIAFPLRFFARAELYDTHYGSLISLKDLPLKKLDCLAANHAIARLIEDQNPCMIARFGSGEVGAMLRIERYQQMNAIEVVYEYIVCGGKDFWSDANWAGLRLNAGFFSVNQKQLQQFLVEMKGACQYVDILGSWTSPESRYQNLLSNASITELANLEPYFCTEPWSASLAGKRVLVIHPYAALINDQYRKSRNVLFPGQACLPQFNLICLQAVQTIAGNQDSRFHNWFDALCWMEDEAMKYEFDVALIGCGAYGFPLAARLKRNGKKAVHLGGALQILFGIKGSRWDERKEFSDMYNEYWVRPSAGQQPQNFKSIEDGCYW
jgi:hypothetical protein